MTIPASFSLLSPPSLPPASGYSQLAVVDSGRLVVISGQVGVDRDWQLARGFPAQADQAFRNLKAAVASAGGTIDDILKLTVFVLDARALAAYCQVRDSHLTPGRPAPASTFLEVRGLYAPEALIEIEAIAILAG